MTLHHVETTLGIDDLEVDVIVILETQNNMMLQKCAVDKLYFTLT